MLAAYSFTEGGPQPLNGPDGSTVPAGTAWIDLFNPTPEEDSAAEAFLGASLPSREEAEEIEFSSRLYAEDGAVFMTAIILTGVDMSKPTLVPLTMVMADNRMVTLRFDELRALKHFMVRACKPGSGCVNVSTAFLGLIEAIIDRTADVLERISADVDRLNGEIFSRRKNARRRGRRLEAMIDDIGSQADLAAKARESLASLERLVQYAGLALPAAVDKGPNRGRLKLAGRDIRSIEDQLDFLSTKITFLLDATLGLTSVEQNEVIRVLTVVATFFFPPTLIGTIYGMNFEFMPELHWTLGYPLALGAMVLSAVLPYFYFRWKGWF